jgi:hypothetical protein
MSAQLTHETVPASTTAPATATTTADPAASPSRGRLGRAWHRIFLAFGEINYANRRIVEVQAPWIVDEQWHRR